MPTFEEKVKSSNLTKTGRLIAEYCLQNKYSIPFQSLADIANRLGVSDVSIVRFARSLGFDGFVDLKLDLQKELCMLIDEDPERIINPVVKFVTNKDLQRDNYNFSIKNANSVYTEIINDIFTRNSHETFEKAAKQLRKSSRKFIAGIRARVGVVETFSTLLKMVVPNVTTISEDGYKAFQLMLDFSRNDCLFLYSYGRYSLYEKYLLERVKESGIFLIVASDQKATPAALAADILLYSRGNINLPFYSSVGNCIIAEIITRLIAELDWHTCRGRIEQSEKYLNDITIRP